MSRENPMPTVEEVLETGRHQERRRCVSILIAAFEKAISRGDKPFAELLDALMTQLEHPKDAHGDQPSR